MKKLISLTLAIMLILSLSVPALAADQTGTAEVTASVGASYTVVLPTKIEFGANKTATADVKLADGWQLGSGKGVTITETHDAMKLTTGETLNYTISGLTKLTKDATSFNLTATISDQDYAAAVAGDYIGTVTFTCTYG